MSENTTETISVASTTRLPALIGTLCWFVYVATPFYGVIIKPLSILRELYNKCKNILIYWISWCLPKKFSYTFLWKYSTKYFVITIDTKIQHKRNISQFRDSKQVVCCRARNPGSRALWSVVLWLRRLKYVFSVQNRHFRAFKYLILPTLQNKKNQSTSRPSRRKQYENPFLWHTKTLPHFQKMCFFIFQWTSKIQVLSTLWAIYSMFKCTMNIKPFLLILCINKKDYVNSTFNIK